MIFSFQNNIEIGKETGIDFLFLAFSKIQYSR